MNIPPGKYARMAYQHMKEYRPKQLRRLIESGALTETLKQIQQDTQDAMEAKILEIKKSYPPMTNDGNHPSYKELLQREETARMMAEEEILPLWVLTPVN